MKNKLFYFILIVIFALGFLLRFYKLGEVPFGFYQDESAIGYNAYSIMQTGRDEHNDPWPLYFKSFGDYKLPVYIYSTIIPISLFGMTEFAVRFPSAIFGFLTLIVFYLFTLELTKRRSIALVSAALLAINPWSLHYNRATFEVSMSLFFFVLGGLLLLLFARKGLITGFFFATLCFIVSLYSYNLTRLLSPILFLVFILTFPRKKSFYKQHAFEFAFSVIVGLALLIPFMLTLRSSGGAASAAGTFLFSSAVVKAPLIEAKSYFVNWPWIFPHLILSTPALLIWQYLQNIVAYFSVEFLFISGSTHGNHGIGNVGQFYLFELPTIIIGIIFAFKNSKEWKNILLLWASATILIASLTRDVPQATRSFFLIIPYEVFSAYGIVVLWSYLKKIKVKPTYYLSIACIVGIFLYSIIFYLASYYGRFPILYAPDWREQDKALSLFIQANQDKYQKVIIDPDSGFIYTSLLFYTKYPPKDFQQQAIWTPDDSEGMSRPVSFGKFEFRPINWLTDYHTPNTLLITSANKKPSDIPAFQTFLYPKRPIVVAIKQELSNYDTQDIAYEVIESQK